VHFATLTEYSSTEVTAQQVVITAPANDRGTTTQAIAHTERPDTVLVTPPGNTPPPNNQPNNPPAQGQQQGGGGQTTGAGLAAVVGAVLNGGSGASGGNVGAGGVNAQGVPSVGVAGGDAQSGGQGGQANGGLPAPLVLALGGTLTTISPTVIANPGSTGSVTAFVLGPGSTLMLGGAPITVSGTAVSAPGSRTTTGGVGGAIASGLGYTGPLAADSMASSVHGPNIPMWVLAAAAGVLGAFAVGL